VEFKADSVALRKRYIDDMIEEDIDKLVVCESGIKPSDLIDDNPEEFQEDVLDANYKHSNEARLFSVD